MKGYGIRQILPKMQQRQCKKALFSIARLIVLTLLARMAAWRAAAVFFWVGVQTKDSPQYEIKAYRCKACGYLESYAL